VAILGSTWRRARRELEHLRGYFDFPRKGHDVVGGTDFQDCARPVLLLCGQLATRRVLSVLEHRLRRDGYGVWSINLGGLFEAFNTQGIDECAERVREKVERLYARHSLGPLSIIGHSKGGLIARYYVKRLGGDRRVRNLITLGTPHNGTPTAYLGMMTVGWMAKDVRQMTPMSPFIRRLKMGAFPRHVRFASIYSKDDRMSPFPSCILETNGHQNLINVEVHGVRHREYLLKTAVYQVIRRELAAGFGEEVRPQLMPLTSVGPAR
jgi:triacylglycerol lipase